MVRVTDCRLSLCPSVRTKPGMAYELFIGDRTFSSWSMRGWLMLETFGLEHSTHMVGLYSGTKSHDLADLAPARLVPVLRLPDGTVVGESFAMAETLAERHPEAGMWPTDAGARATARWIVAEMCSGFSALRGHCPMQLMHVHEGFDVPDDVLKDLSRLEQLWSHARTFASAGDWLFGSWTLADVFFAPVAARVVGYDLPVSTAARAYCERMIAHPAFRAWRDAGLEVEYDPVPYEMGLPTRAWPV